MGQNKLGTVVREVVKVAHISGCKTGHSGRHTGLNALLHQQIPPQRVMQLSGHRNPMSLNEYSNASIDQQKELSHILSNFLNNDKENTSPAEDSAVQTSVVATSVEPNVESSSVEPESFEPEIVEPESVQHSSVQPEGVVSTGTSFSHW